MAEVEFHLHNEVGIKFPPLRPAYSDGELYFSRFRGLVARSTGTSVIGEGGTGRIHLVRDELMEREVALKIPLDSILRDPAAREDVIQETRQAMDLTHPNIVRIHDFHEGQGKWGISMQYVRGKNLDEWRYDAETTGFRRVIRPYTVEAIRDWIAQLCDALRYAHEDARMVHRDIKPKNLMLEKRDGGEKVYITDFGISQRLRLHTMMLSRDQTKAGESKGNMGTLPYMPWEQIAGAAASPLDDVYAVGATIYELITGRPPFYDGGFEQIKVQIREVPPPSMEQRILDLGLHMPPPPDEWEAAVAACLAKRPEDRPQSMRALAAALGFQSGSNTDLEAKVSSQSERINELETQIITLSHAPAPVAAANPELEAELAAARAELGAARAGLAELAGLRTELEAARGGLGALDAIRAERDAARAEATELAPLRDELAAARAEVAALTALQAELEAARGELGGADAALADLNRRVADEARRADEALAEVARLRQAEQDLSAKLSATETERDTALRGGDQALRTFQEESARRISQAEDRVAAAEAKLAAAEAASEEALRQERQTAQQRLGEAEAKLQGLSKESEQALQQARQAAASELQQARQAAAGELQQVRQAAASELQQARQAAEQEIQRATKEAAASAQAASEKARREAEQAIEKARKTEEASGKAVAQAREEGEKRLQKQAEELEKTRQSLAKTVEQKERLEREVATERERQGASLKPLLISLAVAMVLGLGAGLATSLFTGGKADSALGSSMLAYLPPDGKTAGNPVPFELFERYAAAVGVKPGDLHATKGDSGEVRGVSGLTAMNFCNWLTEKQRVDAKLAPDMHFTLPEFPEVQGKAASGTKEWSGTWSDSAASGVLKVAGDADDPPAGFEIHAVHHADDLTFRVALRKVPGG